MKKQLNLYLSIGILGIFIFGSYLAADVYEAFYGDKTIWWTHQEMMIPLDKARDHFEIWINGKLLQTRLDNGSLYAVGDDGERYRVVSKDIGVRLNNWNARQAEILKSALVHAFISGACLAFILAGIVQITRDRKARGRLPG
jgi:hypothetical protein